MNIPNKILKNQKYIPSVTFNYHQNLGKILYKIKNNQKNGKNEVLTKKIPKHHYTKNEIIKWFSQLNISQRIKICSIQNNWLSNILYQMGVLLKYESNSGFQPTEINDEFTKEEYLPLNNCIIKMNIDDSKMQYDDYYTFFSVFNPQKDNEDTCKSINNNTFGEKIQISNKENSFINEIRFVTIDDISDTITLSIDILNETQKLFDYMNIFSKNEVFNKEIYSFYDSENRVYNFSLPLWIKNFEYFTFTQLLTIIFEQVISIYYQIYMNDKELPYFHKDQKIDEIFDETSKLENFLAEESKGDKNKFFKNINFKQVKDEFCLRRVILEKHRYFKKKNDIVFRHYYNSNYFFDDDEAEKLNALEIDNCEKNLYNIFNNSIPKFVNTLFFIGIKSIFTEENYVVLGVLEQLKEMYSQKNTDELLKEYINENLGENKKKEKKKHRKKKKKERIQIINQKEDENNKRDIYEELNNNNNNIIEKNNEIENKKEEEKKAKNKKKEKEFFLFPIKSSKENNKKKEKENALKNRSFESSNITLEKSSNISSPISAKISSPKNSSKFLKEQTSKTIVFSNTMKDELKQESGLSINYKPNKKENNNNNIDNNLNNYNQKSFISSINVNNPIINNYYIIDNKIQNPFLNMNTNINEHMRIPTQFFTQYQYKYPYSFIGSFNPLSSLINNQYNSFFIDFSKEIKNNSNNVSNILNSIKSYREIYINKVKELIIETLSKSYNIDLLFYGSYITELSIESSDVDILVKFENKEKEQKNINESSNYQIEKIINELVFLFNKNCKNLNIEYIKPIYTASVPVLKIQCDIGKDIPNEIKDNIFKKFKFEKSEVESIKFDLTFHEIKNDEEKINIPSQLIIEFIKNSLICYPEIKPILLVLKRYMQICKLNSSFHGGISSFSLFLLLYAYLKNLKLFINNFNMNYPIGKLLFDFFEFYSNFNFGIYCINVNSQKPFILLNELHESGMMILDPFTSLNVAKSSFRVDEIKSAFMKAMNIINKSLYYCFSNKTVNVNILEEIFKLK